MKKDYITVFTAEVARKLLKMGYSIADIKPDKMDEDGKRSLFIFHNVDGLYETIYELTH